MHLRHAARRGATESASMFTVVIYWSCGGEYYEQSVWDSTKLEESQGGRLNPSRTVARTYSQRWMSIKCP